jgi:pimeloyl-ACP methyl ester carboxylesterase
VIASENGNYWMKHEQKIDYERDVKLLIHGWNADSAHISMQPVRNAYLRQNVTHVVSVDWREIAEMPYIVARDLIGAIGKRVCAIFKGFAAAMRVSPGRVHIVGHSLGENVIWHFYEKILVPSTQITLKMIKQEL